MKGRVKPFAPELKKKKKKKNAHSVILSDFLLKISPLNLKHIHTNHNSSTRNGAVRRFALKNSETCW